MSVYSYFCILLFILKKGTYFTKSYHDIFYVFFVRKLFLLITNGKKSCIFFTLFGEGCFSGRVEARLAAKIGQINA